MVSFDALSCLIFVLTTRTHDMIPFYTGPFNWPVSSDHLANP